MTRSAPRSFSLASELTCVSPDRLEVIIEYCAGVGVTPTVLPMSAISDRESASVEVRSLLWRFPPVASCCDVRRKLRAMLLIGFGELANAEPPLGEGEGDGEGLGEGC